MAHCADVLRCNFLIGTAQLYLFTSADCGGENVSRRSTQAARLSFLWMVVEWCYAVTRMFALEEFGSWLASIGFARRYDKDDLSRSVSVV